MLEWELKLKEPKVESATRNLARADSDLWPVLQDEILKMKADRDGLRGQITGALADLGKFSLDDLEACCGLRFVLWIVYP